MHKSFVAGELRAKLKKLFAKDHEAYFALIAKMEEIASSPSIQHYKNLRAPFQHLKRVHVMKSFVLVFSYDKAQDMVEFLDFDHHDRIYR